MIGVDLVYIPKFAQKIKDESVLRRLFADEELEIASGSVEKLAGMHAAKEAFFKAIKSAPDWHAVSVEHNADGSPRLETAFPAGDISVSISHEGEYAVAVVMLDK